MRISRRQRNLQRPTKFRWDAEDFLYDVSVCLKRSTLIRCPHLQSRRRSKKNTNVVASFISIATILLSSFVHTGRCIFSLRKKRKPSNPVSAQKRPSAEGFRCEELRSSFAASDTWRRGKGSSGRLSHPKRIRYRRRAVQEELSREGRELESFINDTVERLDDAAEGVRNETPV